MNPTAEPLRLLHHHPGYLRVQATRFIGSEETGTPAALVRAAAESMPGVRRCAHNPRTGSIVLEYQPGAADADEILARVAATGGLNGVQYRDRREMNRKELLSTFLDTIRGVNGVVLQATGGRADLREIVPVALWATSVFSFVLHDPNGRLPRWDSALYHGYRIFLDLHVPELKRREWAAMREETRVRASPSGDEAGATHTGFYGAGGDLDGPTAGGLH